ncbi:ATP-dependent RNA helicase [Clarireedia jacksonii]
MPIEQKKRPRSDAKGYSKASKRQKIQKVSKTAPKRQVAVDSLPWNEVQMPEMFDDAEGFYGLEEVDGVEILREGDVVRFMSSKVQAQDDEEEFKGFGDDEVPTPANDTGKLPETGPAQEKPKQTEKKEKKEQKGKKEKADKSQKKAEPKKQTSNSDDKLVQQRQNPVSNVFEALEEKSVEEIDMSGWVALDLSSQILSALSKLKFSKPTPIQTEAIPQIIEGHDVVGKAATGSGKTLAFGVPIVEKWLELYGELDEEELKKTSRPPIALILSPTRELAHQLTEHITAVCNGLPTSPYVAAVTGGLSVQKQQRQLTKADIVVGTPGRLWEVISSSNELSASFRQIKFLVIDEADRLLTEGHFKEAEEILNALDRVHDDKEDDDAEEEKGPPARQTLVFSATFHKGLQQKLAGKGKQALMDDSQSMEYLLKKLNFREDKPKFVDVNPISQMAANLKEGMVECGGEEKARMRSIERFSSGKSNGSVLVATDVAARGLDIGGVQLVIHYHLPRTADMYVHRSGRTARAAASGSSILLCGPEEVAGTRRLVAKVHAQNALAGEGKKSKFYIRSLDIDRKVVSRLKPRVTLAKKIADSALAKEKKGHDDDWVKNAAEELGVDYDSEEFEAAGGGRKGRGTGRKIKEKEARGMSKGEVAALRAELRALLAQRVNVGVSERYLASGTVDVNELLKGTKGEWLGQVDGIGLDDF